MNLQWLKNIPIRAHHVRWTGFGTACIAVAVVFFVLGAFLRLLVGPVSLNAFNGTLSQAIGKALPGLSVRYDGAALEWSRDEGRIDLVVLGARIFDAQQHIIAQAPKAEIGLAASAFFRGDIQVKSIALVGVQLALVRDKDGTLRLGIGNDRERGNVLDRIREDLLKNKTSAGTLRTFAVRHARLAFFDAGSGLFVVAPEADLQVTAGDASAQGALLASVNGDIEISGHRSHVVASLTLPRSHGLVKGDVSVTGLALQAVAANAPSFAFLKPFGLKVDFSGSFLLENGTRLKFADFGLGASGTISGLSPHPVHVKSFKVVARYDADAGRLLIDDATLEGRQASAHLTGNAQLSFASGDVLKLATFAVYADKIAIDMPGLTGETISFARASLQGTYTPATEDIAIEKLLVSGGPLQADLTGHIVLGRNGSTPAITLNGRMQALAVRDLLRYWPLNVGSGAREWIDRNVSAGRVGPMLIHANIAAGAMQLPALPEDAVNVSFPISGATIAYLHGLTPLTQASGNALLTGDSFTGTIFSANVGPIRVSNTRVRIAGLHVHGAPAIITGHVDGQLNDVLTLIDMKPLQYPSRFHLSPQSARGMTSSDLSFRVPTLENLSVDQVGILVKTQVTNMALAIGQHTKITNGNGAMVVDNDKLHATGNVTLGGAAPLAIDWTEVFEPKGPYSTDMHVKGTLDAAGRAALGIGKTDFLSGPVGVTADLQGRAGVFQHGQINVDLTPATLTFDLVNFSKPAGEQASAQLVANFDNGVLRATTISASGASLSAQGDAQFDANGDLEQLDLPVVHAGPLNDFSLVLNEGPGNGFDATVKGRSADGTALGRHNGNTNPQNANKPPVESNDPFRVSAHLQRLALRDGVAIAPFALDVSGVGDSPRAMTLSGAIGKNKVSGTITENASGRQVALHADDAGNLLKGLFDFDSIHGGTLNIVAAMPPVSTKGDPAAPDYKGHMNIDNFRIVKQGFLARLFSAGSLPGLVDLLRGEGIEIDKLEAPFSVKGGVIAISDATASGPSLGISADGYVDRRSNQLKLRGALAPIYGINGLLNGLPILGSLLTSKKGEGIVGMTYTASGNADEPDIDVNPLSILAPGILRRVFEGNTPKAPEQANTAPPQQPKSR